MIWYKLYFTFIGLYFSVVQLSYFLLLQLNVSSTYITYMVVVIAWMIGIIVGLWWTKLSTLAASVLSGVAYYLVFLLVSVSPLSMWTLFFASFGVLISGIWAGHFFVAYFSKMQQADILFFHENNGFLLGILFTIFGFSMHGNNFLLWGPLYCAILLISTQVIMKTYVPQE